MPEFCAPSATACPVRFTKSAIVPVSATSEDTTKCSTFCHSIETERRFSCGPLSSSGPVPEAAK